MNLYGIRDNHSKSVRFVKNAMTNKLMSVERILKLLAISSNICRSLVCVDQVSLLLLGRLSPNLWKVTRDRSLTQHTLLSETLDCDVAKPYDHMWRVHPHSLA